VQGGCDDEEERSRHDAADQQANPAIALRTGLVRRPVGPVRGGTSLAIMAMIKIIWSI
jgi:hypothetical protein